MTINEQTDLVARLADPLAQIAARLIAPASELAWWTYDKARKLLIKAIEEEQARQK